MFASQHPTVQLPESFQWPPSAVLPAHTAGISKSEIREIVISAVKHLGDRLQGKCFTVSPTVVAGSTRSVLTVSAVDQNESFVVKVASRESPSYQYALQRPLQPSFTNPFIASYLAPEDEVNRAGGRRVSLAAFVEGETLLDIATKRGLSERDWDIAYNSIPRLMEAIWRHARSPYDPSLGLIFDHHFDNIVIGIKKPPFGDGSRASKRRIVFVDGRDDGAFHSKHTLEDAIEDFRALLKQHGVVRSTWG